MADIKYGSGNSALSDQDRNMMTSIPVNCLRLLLLTFLWLIISPAFAVPTVLSETDKHASVELSGDALGAVFSVPNRHRAVRSTRSIEPGSGFYYYEGHREVQPGNFGFGVATATETLANFGGYSDQSLGVNALGYIFYNRSNQITGDDHVILANDTFGLAVDYRGVNPTVYVIVGSALFYTQTLDNVTEPLFIFVYGHETTSDVQQSINVGSDLASSPFVYDYIDVLTSAGIAGAQDITLGWQEPPVTSLSIIASNLVADTGDTVTLVSSAANALGEDIAASTQWTNLATAATATGDTFSVTSVSPGTILIQATVFDESGFPVVDTVSVEFQLDPAGDQDLDGLPNGFETDNGLDPLTDDANDDPDGDGYSNIAEYLAGTHPQNAALYPGAPVQTVLSDTDIGDGVTLGADALGAIFSIPGSHHGVRSNVAITPGSGFFYFEGHREVASGNFGFGIATSTTSLNNFGGRTDQSLGVNAAGYIFHDNSALVAGNSVIESADTFGIAVDYRGATPAVYVVIDDMLFFTRNLATISDPLYIYVYGHGTTDGVQQTINAGGDINNVPYAYDVRSILANASVSGAESVYLGWGEVPPQTEIMISGGDSANVGTIVTLTATATSATGVDIANSVTWLDEQSGVTGAGAQFALTASVVGTHTVTATVINELGIDIVDQHVVSFIEPDSDADGLTDAIELQLGTDVNHPDSDDDGLLDGDEVNVHGTNPLVADTDADGVGDAIEVGIGSDPQLADGELDSDGDSFSNSQEVLSGTDPGSPYSYPGAPTGTRISGSDKHASLNLSNDGNTVTFTDSESRSGRSTVSISPGDGWYYIEGRRDSPPGNFGIGLASTTAPLASGAGENTQSIGLTTDGRVRYDGFNVVTYEQAIDNEHYGLGVDYTGPNPVVYPVVTGQDGYTLVLDPVVLTEVSGNLHVVTFGQTQSGGSSITINAGDHPDVEPFHYAGNYEIFTAGYEGAEFMGAGWGEQHNYAGLDDIPDMSVVRFEIDEHSGPDITLSADGLSAAYGLDEKMGVRANQGMIGEFRYYEGIRLLDEVVKLGNGIGLGFGYGLATEHSRINPYPFDPEQPSMSVNAANGIWQNLNYMQTYNTDVYHYGFAVDYRDSRPLIHVIIDDEVVRSMQLSDVFTPLYPLNYGNTQGQGVFATSSNFGATPFFYNPKGALERAGISTLGFVSGWGEVNNDTDADNLLDSVEIALGTAVNQTDSDNDGLRDGDEYHVHGTSPLSADTDADSMPDAYEVELGQNPLVNDQSGDVDNDGISNLEEYQTSTGLVNLPPVLNIEVDTVLVDIGESFTFSATASDIIDGNLAAAVQWSYTGGLETGTGPDFVITPVAGIYTVMASVTDSGGLTAQVQIEVRVVDPSMTDTDVDGLSDDFEVTIGTDPDVADTDADGLNDGSEVNTYNTNPLLPDTDGDGLSDYYEVMHGFNPLNALDALEDADNDGRSNLLESQLGTDPNVADPPALTDIIIDNDDAEAAVIAGQFTRYDADEQYGASATYARVGGAVDRFRFTPTIAVSSDYEVFAWNSCYNNRAANVAHIVQHANGVDSIDVDQGCNTGSHGEWFSLGIFALDVGTSAYLEITDDGVVPDSTTYMGADAARFLLVDNNQAPQINASNSQVSALAGDTLTLTATAFDAEDGDLTAQLDWSDGLSDTATGGSFIFTPVAGDYTVTVSVSDSEGRSTSLSIPVSVVADDNDGLSVAEELALGTDPANPDTDNDGISDGDEVNVYSSNPLSPDTDDDGLPDQFEINNGLNPAEASDATLDTDGDGLTNLEEFLSGTDPNVSDNNTPTDIVVINGDSGTEQLGRWNAFNGGESYAGESLWATVGGEVNNYRFTPMLPVSGHYEVFAWNDCFGNRAIDVRHSINHAGGDNTIEVDQDCDTGTHGEWFSLGVYPFEAGSAGYLEISDEGINSASTTYLGADAARFVLTDTNQPPVLVSNLLDTTIVAGEQLSLVATAQDTEDGDLSAMINWLDGSGADAFIGSNYVVQPIVGNHEFTVSVTDSEGAVSSLTATITVVGSLSDLDSDSDGLSDSDELLHGTDSNNEDTDGDSLLDGAEINEHSTNPNNTDSDFDLMNDGFEVNYLLNPNDPNDAYLDNDGDGLTNLEEHDAGSDPNTVPVIDIIMTNGDPGTDRTGNWSDFAGRESLTASSLWATAGGNIDRYRFTPSIEIAGYYEIYAWNSCYANRATNVPHIIRYGDLTDTVAVDQDCDTGSHGEWFFLGTYYLPTGSTNYVEITDETLVPPTTTYIGADSVRFLRQ